MSESVWDILRVLSGMAAVCASAAPVINGGDAGGEHPTQALIDLGRIERFAGKDNELHIDLASRTTRSLILSFAAIAGASDSGRTSQPCPA